MTNVNTRARVLNVQFDCQKIKPFSKPKKTIHLPITFGKNRESNRIDASSYYHQYYSRYATIYYQDLIAMPIAHPKLYEQFKKGYFTFKRSNVPGTSVAPDMGLEQTANKSKKSSAGVIGSTSNENYVTVWDMTHHENLTVQNLSREIAYVTTDSEYKDHHELNKIKRYLAVSKLGSPSKAQPDLRVCQQAFIGPIASKYDVHSELQAETALEPSESKQQSCAARKDSISGFNVRQSK